MPRHTSPLRLLKIAALVALATALAQPSALANTMYTLTLTPTSGSISGTGTMVLETAIPATGSFTVTQGGAVSSTSTDLISLTFTMSNGDVFNFSNETSSSNAFFSNDVLENLSYNDDNPLPTLEIGGSNYGFTASYQYAGTNGNVTFNPTPVTPTPEPTSILLVGTALLLFIPQSMRETVFNRLRENFSPARS